jgi:hypothetical protein
VDKPGLVRFHYFPGMSSLSYVVSKTCGYLVATSNISVKGIC